MRIYRRGILIFILFLSLILIFQAVDIKANNVKGSSQFDWRDHGYDFPVLDQGSCKAGYAFAGVETIQAAIWKKDGIKVYFSENHAINCNWNAINNYNDYPFHSCIGGDFKMIVNLFTQYGLVQDSCDPFSIQNRVCNLDCKAMYYITEWQHVSRYLDYATIDTIKELILNHGPIYAQMDANIPGFEDFDGSEVIYAPDNNLLDNNHAVLIVGWDDDIKHEEGNGAWIAKNSYGPDWGNDGYFTIAYGSAGIGNNIAVVTGWEKSSSITKLYFYDDAGHTTQTSNGEFFKPNQVLALFTPEGDEIAQTVEFWSNDTASVNLQIYDQFSNGILSDLLYESLNVDIPFAGYYSITLSPNIEIKKEDEIVVVLEIKNKSNLFPIAVDNLGILSEDRTWIKNDQGIWKSLPETMKFDAGVRLRTFVLPDGFYQSVFLPLVRH